ncbi:MAG TPA: hypothetical protein VGB59_03335 [Allosphingosinicella sp.]
MHDPHVILRLETKRPIQIGDFVSAFTALGNEYERFIRVNRPDLAPEASIYVRQVREGSIEAELIPMAVTGAAMMLNAMDQMMILEQFVQLYGGRLKTFFKPQGRLSNATKSELVDFLDQVRAIANDPEGTAEIEAVDYRDGHRKVRAAIKFRTPEARTARAEIVDQQRELQSRSDVDHERVLMRFVRPSIEDVALGKRTGERAVIEKVYPKALPVVYASDLAEQRIRHEMLQSHENVFKKLFDVDVNVELRGDGKPMAYRIVALHTVTDALDDE